LAKSISTSPVVADRGTEGHCGKNSQPASDDDAPHNNSAENQELIADGYEVVRAAVKLFGPQKKLAFALGKDPRYGDRIGEGINREGDHYTYLDWLVPLLRNPRSSEALLQYLCRIAGREMPAPRKTPTKPETDARRARKVREKYGQLLLDIDREIADEDGISVADLPR
jgi:hypothetical protein